jgi:hypothetical protein
MTVPTEETEWRRLIERLQNGEEPELPGDVAPIFDDATTRQRVGVLITKAILGEPFYRRYQLYCGDTPPSG